ncbi:hypothetical protein [Rhizobium rhizogenes]|uniref:Uncharacterized protein n=1 Tax=Rhizobium rhizogenes (strain K84 / ATCC BAA-868) TaxID=311403 RepID=B9JPQ9_RHIR8|nr:hypothetical protein Arad_12052 [Rhizobium rhizogenes K84]NTG77886.1 hypothetical protein [Rhizobium rhizogenes]
MRRTILVLISLCVFFSISLKAFACTNKCVPYTSWCACTDDPPNIFDPKKAVEDAVNNLVNSFTKAKITDAIKLSFPLSGAINEVAKASGDQTLVAAVNSFEAIGAKLDTESQTAITNALTNPSKGVRDAAQNLIKSANDGVQAIQAAARYGERTLTNYQEVFSEAERRAREGKVVDAVWHLGMDPMTRQSANMAQLMKESDVARDAFKTLVTTQAGPAGAAAFAAWYEYYSSNGDIQKALSTGIYTYAVASGHASVDSMPSGTIEETVKKSAAAAALRGVAVAASGGSQQDILNAAAQSGGAVIVQSGQAYATKEYIDPAKAKTDQFCIDAVNETCEDAVQWIDDTKKQLKDYNDQLAQNESLADSLPTSVVTADGQWAISWNQKALLDPKSKTPGAVLTYVGPTSFYRKQMIDLAALGRGDGLFPHGGPSINDSPDRFSAEFPDGKWRISNEGQRIFAYDTDLLGFKTTANYYINESSRSIESLYFWLQASSGWQRHGDDDETYSGVSEEKVYNTCSSVTLEKIEVFLFENIGAIDGKPIKSDEDISRSNSFSGICSSSTTIRSSDICERTGRRINTVVHFKSKKQITLTATSQNIFVAQMENHGAERRIFSYGRDSCNISIAIEKPFAK